MRGRRCLTVLMVALLAGPAGAHAQGREWWKEPPESRLDQKIPDPSGQASARIKWDDGYIEVRAGGTADKALALNQAHLREMALRAARNDGYRRLAELVESVAVDGVTVVKNAMVVDQTVRTRVQARIRGAVVASEQVRDLPDGGVWAEVVMGLRLRGAGSLTESVGAWAASRPVDPYRPDPAFRVNEPYTGLILDASDAGFLPALAPRLVEEGSGKVVFGPQMVQQAALNQQGSVDYAIAMSEARQKGRAGANPLIVRAVATAGALKGDLVLSRRDAERVLAADRAGRFLDRAAVVIVHGKEQRELTAQPGGRYALVIGIDDYQQAQSGYSRLTYAARDARTLAALLQQSGGFVAGTVTLLENRDATRQRVLDALRGLRVRLRDEDTVVIFFSGHGSVGPADDGRLHYYLVPHDGQLADLARTALKDDELEEAIGNLPARQVVVILDACYSGGGTTVLRARGITNPAVTAAPAGRALVEASAGRVVISASKSDQPAFEDDQRGGLFTSFLLEGLRGGADLNSDGAVTVLELFQFVSPQLREYTRRTYQVEQTPVLEVRVLSGEIVLVRLTSASPIAR